VNLREQRETLSFATNYSKTTKLYSLESMDTQWKPYGDRYIISNYGLVYRFSHHVKAKGGSYRKIKAGFIKLTIDRYKYINVCLYSKDKRLHKIIAELFLPNPDNLTHLIHKDGNSLNLFVTNLQWVTKEIYYQNKRTQIDDIHHLLKNNNTTKNNSQLLQYLMKNYKKKL